MKSDRAPSDELQKLLRALKLPSFLTSCDDFARRGEREGWSFARYLLELSKQEIQDRGSRRIERLQKASHLPPDKTLATLDTSVLSASIKRQLATLCEGRFAEQAVNVLLFGLPGRGKSHLCAAIGHELVLRGISVLYKPAYQIAQQLLRAKRDLRLEKEMRALDRFAVIALDDIGYVQQERSEMEVLFTFLAERYERRSVMITSNLVFSQWDKIFKDPMTTQAAIDRLVHHSIILELTGPSYRIEEAKKRKRKKEEPEGEDESKSEEEGAS
jgi:DNA replication protein DnaC